MLEKIKLLYQAINDEFSVLLDADTEERAKTLVGYLGDELGYECFDCKEGLERFLKRCVRIAKYNG